MSEEKKKRKCETEGHEFVSESVTLKTWWCVGYKIIIFCKWCGEIIKDK